MTQAEVTSLLQRGPSVHQLTFGAYIQEVVPLSDTLFAVPLKSLGYKIQAHYLTEYAAFVGAVVDEGKDIELASQAASALPVISIVKLISMGDTAIQLEDAAAADLAMARNILSWISGNRLTAFGMLVRTLNEVSFRIMPPEDRTRLRLGFGNTGEVFQNQVKRTYELAQKDEQFSFSLSILFMANTESNPKFRIAYYFNCLESLAYKVKGKIIGTRKAVKYLLGLESGAMKMVSIGGKTYHFDVIEIAGRIRDKLLHGVPFRPEDLIESARDAYELYEQHPEKIASAMQTYCELEIARWANGTSKGLQEPDMP